MPTYEYSCPSCGEQQEIVQSMSDPTLTDCPLCGKPGLRKLFNGVGVVFKGSGFYRTDSRSDSGSGSDKGSSASSDKGDKGKPAKDGSGSSGSKPDSSGSSQKSTKESTSKTSSDSKSGSQSKSSTGS